jgi:Xaa-Pro dipeptidase
MSIPRHLVFEEAEYEQRLERVQRTMVKHGMNTMLLFSPHNIFYLSGMDSENLFDYQCLLVPAHGEPVLVILDFELARFENSAWVRQVETYSAFEDSIDATLSVVNRLKGSTGTIGVERQTRVLSIHHFERIAAGLRHADLVDAFGVVEDCRLVKSSAEIAYMRRAAELTELGIEAGYAAMSAGVFDYEIAAAIVGSMYRNGSETLCWGPIVAAGYRAGSAHSTFNGYRLKVGDTVFLEVTAEVRRYTAPLMRTAILGDPPEEIRRLSAVVTETVEVILEKARTDAKASEVAKAALTKLEPLLDDLVFHHGFGYPVGIGYPPSWIEQLGYFIRVDNDRPLKAGMVLHLPISLRKYGEYAINLSQTILVGEDRSEPLGRSPADLRVVNQ